MRLFGNRLSIISTSELIQYASCTNIKIRLDLCPCKELGKLVARVVVLAKQRAEEQLGVLVDDNSTDYFVAGKECRRLAQQARTATAVDQGQGRDRVKRRQHAPSIRRRHGDSSWRADCGCERRSPKSVRILEGLAL
jgi:hypothetical protein